jgi:hypothetical protein
LSIVSAIAHAHGGTVGVVSDPSSGNGTSGATFWVRIPLAGAVGAIPGNAPLEQPVVPDGPWDGEMARDDTATPERTGVQEEPVSLDTLDSSER